MIGSSRRPVWAASCLRARGPAPRRWRTGRRSGRAAGGRSRVVRPSSRASPRSAGFSPYAASTATASNRVPDVGVPMSTRRPRSSADVANRRVGRTTTWMASGKSPPTARRFASGPSAREQVRRRRPPRRRRRPGRSRSRPRRAPAARRCRRCLRSCAARSLTSGASSFHGGDERRAEPRVLAVLGPGGERERRARAAGRGVRCSPTRATAPRR